jgi:DNA-binding ferritin-like protein
MSSTQMSNEQATRIPTAGMVDISARIHGICDRYNDAATASLIENWIDETERRAWFLRETVGR